MGRGDLEKQSSLGAHRSLRGDLRRASTLATVAFLILVSMAGMVTWHLLTVTEDEVQRYLAASRISRDLNQAMLDQESGLRGYQLTGDESFLDPFHDGRVVTTSSLTQLNELVGSNPDVRDAYIDARLAVINWETDFADPALANLRAFGDVSQGQTELGRELFNEFRTIQVEHQARIRAAQQQASDRQRLEIIFGVAVLAGIAAVTMLVTGSSYRRLSKALVPPLSAARNTMSRVGRGDFSPHEAPGGPHELQVVNVGLAEMVRRLRDTKVREDERISFEADRTERLVELLANTRLISGGGDVESVANAVAGAAAQVARAERATVWLMASDGELVLVADQADPGAAPVLEACPLMHEAASMMTVVGAQPTEGGRVAQAEIAIPMSSGGRCVGVIGIGSLVGGPLNEMVITLLEALAANGGSSVERARLSDRVDLILQSSSDGIIGTNQDGRATFVNESACSMLGYSSAEILGAAVHQLLHHHRADGSPYPEEECPTRHTLKSSQTWRVDGEVLWRKDGTALPVEWTTSPLVVQGVVEGAVLTFVDVSARRRVQDELASARDRAEEASRLKSEFLANMSHEIRTPLNGVVGMTSFLLDTDLDDQQREFAHAINGSGQALLEVINDILDLSKIEAGKIDLEETDVHVRTVVDEVADLFALRAYEKGLELALLVEPMVPEVVTGDPARYRQVLTNLVGNAIKFTDVGEVVVTVSLDSRPEGQVVLRTEVRDTGVGLLAEQKGGLFQKFSQADASTTRRFGGTGLGLAICKQLTELMGGNIGVESEYGAGSTFWFTTAFGYQPRQPAGPDLDLTRVRSLKVLVVDDNETNRRILELELQAWGARVALAPDAEQALRHLRLRQSRSNQFNIVVLDAQMPDVDGYQLAEQIVADPSLDGLRLILLTSSIDNRPISPAVQERLIAKMTKPVRQSLVRQALSAAVGLVPQRQAAAVAPEASTEADLARPGDAGRLLVVEDNPTNQRVTALMAERIGYKTDIANNGREALEAVQLHRYDVVLMDCQMPVMDGHSATRAIRNLDPPRCDVPIIAMTASVTPDERQRCLDCGMNEYLAKPVNIDQLRRTIARARATQQLQFPLSAVVGEPMPETVFVDEQRFVGLCGLGGNDEEQLQPLVQGFLDGVAQRCDDLEAAMRRGDIEAAARAAHGIAGSGATFASIELARLASQLEGRLRNGAHVSADEVVQELRSCLAVTGAELRSRLTAVHS